MAVSRNAIIIASDAAIFPAAVFAAARIASLNPPSNTDIFIFTDSAADIEIARREPLPFRVLPLIFPEGIKAAITYFRVFAPIMLGKTHRRILYLDVDTYVENANLFRLFDLDLGDHVFAAVRDPIIAFMPDAIELEFAFAGRHRKYLNAGVLMIDVAAYIERQIPVNLVKLVQDNARKLRFADQSALNCLLDGNWLELSPSFNMFAYAWDSFVRRAFPPVVVHFAGMPKAWSGHFGYDHPAHAAMQRFFPKTAWPDFLSRFAGEDGDPTAIRPPYERGIRLRREFYDYYRATEFADVRQGLTTPHREHVPPSP